MLANDTMRPNCNFLKAECNRSLNTICFYYIRWSFPILILHISAEAGADKGGLFFSSIQNPFLDSPLQKTGRAMAKFHEESNKNDQSSKNNHENTDWGKAGGTEVILCAEIEKEEWQDASLQTCFFQRHQGLAETGQETVWPPCSHWIRPHWIRPVKMC